jgi:tetratricopeptide (TPR) repeat protein
VRLLHLGYGLDDVAQDKKNRRNRKLLEQLVREEPDNAYAHFTLAQNYGLTGEPGKAVKHYKRAWKLQNFTKGMQASLLNTMAEAEMKVGKSQDALRHCQKSIALIPEQVGAYYLLLKMAEEQQNDEDALKWILELFRRNEQLKSATKRLSTDVLFDEILLGTKLAGLYLKTGRQEKALERLRLLLKKYPDSEEIKQKLLQIASDSGDFVLAEQVLEEVHPTDIPLFWDLLGLILLKQQKFKEAIAAYEHLFQLQPDHIQTVKKLAGLYAKTGDMVKAEAIIRHLNGLNK